MIKTPNKIPLFIQAIIIVLLFVTPFRVSDELYNGLITAKEFWFFGVVAFILLYGGIHLLFTKQTLKVNLNLTDILLVFYAWCFARACFTPYTPVLYNHKLQMLTGGVVVYFFIKGTMFLNERNEENEENEMNKKNNIFSPSFIHLFIPSFLKSFISSLNKFSTRFHFCIIVILISGLIHAVYGLLQLYGFYPSNHGLFKITGSFFNPAPYAIYLAVVFPMALGTYLLRNEKNEMNENNEYNEKNEQIVKNNSFNSSLLHLFISSITHYIALATLIAIILVLPATMIRASWLGALAGSLLVLWFAIKQQIISLPRWFKNLFASKTKSSFFILGLVAIVTIGSIFLYRIKEGSSIGKSFIWEVTLGKIAEKPLMGHGLGRFEAEYNNWQAEYFQNHPKEMDGAKGLAAGNTKYCFNEYLEMASETGLIGLGLFLASVGALFIGAMKKLKNENNEENEQTAENSSFTPSFIHSFIIVFTASFLSLLIIAAISYPFYNAPILILFFIVMGLVSAPIGGLSSRLKIITNQFSKPIYPILKYVAALFLIACSISISYNQYHKSIAYKNWQKANYAYQVGDFTGANEIYKANFEQLKYEGIFVQQYGKSLQMAAQNKQAIAILNKASKLTSDHVLYCTLGDAYKADKEYAGAENAYFFASSMMPHLLYPHYLLAKLYNESGQQEEAIVKANEILAKSAKTKSTAVKEIKEEMKKLINENNKK